AEHLDQEHLEEAVVADQLEGDLGPLAGQLLAAVPGVLDPAPRGEVGDHLADAGRRDAKALRELARRDGPLVAAEQIKGLEVVLLAAGEGAATFELFDQIVLGLPILKDRIP